MAALKSTNLIESDTQANSEQAITTDAVSAMDSLATIKVVLAYAPSIDEQYYEQITVRVGSTLYEVLASSGWLDRFEPLARWCEQVQHLLTPTPKIWHIGVYSQKQPLSYVVQPQDRIEIYRSLTIDPMKKRKKRAQKRQ